MEGAITIKDKEFVPYIDEKRIQSRIIELAREINSEYAGKNPLLIVVLNGAFVFAADLIRELSIDPEVQFIRISTYGDGMISSKDAQRILGLDIGVEGREVILLEDIVETGFTVGLFMDQMEEYAPKNIKLASLLFKPEQFEGKHPPDFVGFEIPGAFVVGYGLDYAQKGRELKGIYQLKS